MLYCLMVASTNEYLMLRSDYWQFFMLLVDILLAVTLLRKLLHNQPKPVRAAPVIFWAFDFENF